MHALSRMTIVLTLATVPASVVCAGSPFSPLALEYLSNGGVSDATGADLTSAVTYDVFVHNMTGRAIHGVVGFDFGSQGDASRPLHGIPINGTIFNHFLGNDTNPDETLFPSFAALRFDSYWTFGDQPVAFEPGSVDLDAKDALLNGRFTVSGTPRDLGVGEYLRVARVTFLDGNFDYERPLGFDAILEDGTRVRFGVPGPWSCATIGIALACATERRRA